MNTYDIDEARERFRDHPVLGPATATLVSLRDATNANSDGWAYWPKPVRAAEKLMALVMGDSLDIWDRVRLDATPARLTKAYIPLKAFRTRSKLPFRIYETSLVAFPSTVECPECGKTFPAEGYPYGHDCEVPR